MLVGDDSKGQCLWLWVANCGIRGGFRLLCRMFKFSQATGDAWWVVPEAWKGAVISKADLAVETARVLESLCVFQAHSSPTTV